MGSIWAYLLSQRTALSHFKMSRPDGVLFSPAPTFLPPLQTNQYSRSLAFHRKDYREMAIKGLASITPLISKPLKDFSGRGLGPRTWCPVTLQEHWASPSITLTSVGQFYEHSWPGFWCYESNNWKEKWTGARKRTKVYKTGFLLYSFLFFFFFSFIDADHFFNIASSSTSILLGWVRD